MLRRFSTNFAILSIGIDLITVAFSLWGINQIRPVLSRFSFAKQIVFPQALPVQMYVIFPLAWVLIMMFFSVYDGRKNIRIVDEFANLTTSSLMAGIILAGILYFSFRETSRITFIFFVLVTYLLLVLWRVLVRIPYRARNQTLGKISRILIAGAGPVGKDIRDAHPGTLPPERFTGRFPGR